MKQFAVIGLGNFGFYLATRLFNKGHEVLAIDKNETLVQEIRDNVSQAVIADTTDPKVISELGLQSMDAVIVCIGSILSSSILTTLNLKDIGVKHIIAKAITEPHGRILQKVGANDIYFPERDSALSLADHLHDPNMIDYLPFIEGYSIIQVSISSKLVGKSLRELDLINRYGIQVIAVKESIPTSVNMIPTGNYVLKKSDTLFLLGPDNTLDRFRKDAD